MPVQMARKLRGVQCVREPLFRKCPAQHSTQHLRKAMSPILALPVGKVSFDIVIDPPGPVRLLDFRPDACVRESVIGEPPLD